MIIKVQMDYTLALALGAKEMRFNDTYTSDKYILVIGVEDVSDDPDPTNPFPFVDHTMAWEIIPDSPKDDQS